jgi:hypothetical protein
MGCVHTNACQRWRVKVDKHEHPRDLGAEQQQAPPDQRKDDRPAHRARHGRGAAVTVAPARWRRCGTAAVAAVAPQRAVTSE